jgi:hypothetical protein
MNKFFSTILLIFLPFAMFCNTDDSVKTKKLQIGALYSPELCYRTLKATSRAKWIEDMRDTMEIPKFGYSAGVNLAYQLSNKFSFEVELLFSDKGERTKQYSLEYSAFSEPSLNPPSSVRFSNHYYYLDLPLKLNYYLIKKQVNFYLTTGISINTFLYQTTTSFIEKQDGSVEKTNSTTHPKFQKMNFAAMAGFGISYQLSDKYIFKLEPVFKHGITSIVNAPVKNYLYSVGVNVGIAYTF